MGGLELEGRVGARRGARGGGGARKYKVIVG